MDYITGLTYDQVKNMYAEKQYVFLEKPYQINIVGFRNKDIDTVDQFNDWIGIAYVDTFGNKHFLIWPATTKPGLSYLGQTMGNDDGTGILQPGQYLNIWGLGIHGHADPHAAFVQAVNGVFKVWRDADKDGKLDMTGKTFLNVTGLNGHRATQGEIFKVGPYSAACQVWQEDKEHQIAVALGRRHYELYAGLFNYTLFQLQ